MKIDILTLFPEMFAPLKESIIKRAADKGLIKINIVDIRNFANPPHFKCDDEPFGGGAGMVMMCEPLFAALESVLDKADVEYFSDRNKIICTGQKTDEKLSKLSLKKPKTKIFYMSPRGVVFNQNMAKNLSGEQHIVLVCGHYEGIDQRVLDYFEMEELSIGDYVLTGGELPAMVVADAIIRLIPDAISPESTVEETFSNNLLEYNQYTRPATFRGLSVPEVLLSGNHKKIADYRKEQSKQLTAKFRPDLLKK